MTHKQAALPVTENMSADIHTAEQEARKYFFKKCFWNAFIPDLCK